MDMLELSSGLEMPVVGFGTFNFTSNESCSVSVCSAIKYGCTLIDCASFYRNEEAVGEGIRRSGIDRDKLYLTSKVWFDSYEPDDCARSIETTLEKLGTDYLDMMLLHWPYGNYYGAWRVLEDYCRRGVICSIGVSNFSAAQVIDLIKFNKIRPVVNQVEMNLYCQQKDLAPWMEKYDVKLQAYAPLGHGHGSKMMAEPAVLELASKYGRTPAQIILRFLVQTGISVIPKSEHEERIRENIQIEDFEFTDAEMTVLRNLDRDMKKIGRAGEPHCTEATIELVSR